jgi:hypothetical protein
MADNFIDFNINIDPSVFKIAPGIKKGIINGLEEAAEKAKEKARDSRLPGTFKTRTGTLRNQRIQRDQQADRIKLQIGVGINEREGDPKNPPYGKYLNEGTKHIKAMKFIQKGIASVKIADVIARAIERATR